MLLLLAHLATGAVIFMVFVAASGNQREAVKEKIQEGGRGLVLACVILWPFLAMFLVSMLKKRISSRFSLWRLERRVKKLFKALAREVDVDKQKALVRGIATSIEAYMRNKRR